MGNFFVICHKILSVQFSSVTQFCLTLCNPWIVASQASLSITNSQSSFKLMSIMLVIPSNHLILCHPLLLLSSTSTCLRVCSIESVLRIRWPKYSISVLPMNIQDWLPLRLVACPCSPRDSPESSPAPQWKNINSHRCIEQTFGLCGRRRVWDVSREQHQNMYII